MAKSNKDTSMVGEKKRAGQSNVTEKVDSANIKHGGLKLLLPKLKGTCF